MQKFSLHLLTYYYYYEWVIQFFLFFNLIFNFFFSDLVLIEDQLILTSYEKMRLKEEGPT
jgi:hypothetical protein